MRWTSFLLALLTSVLLAGCGLLGKAKNLGTAKGKPNFELVIRAQPEAAKAEQEAARREKTIVLADARAARAEQ